MKVNVLCKFVYYGLCNHFPANNARLQRIGEFIDIHNACYCSAFRLLFLLLLRLKMTAKKTIKVCFALLLLACAAIFDKLASIEAKYSEYTRLQQSMQKQKQEKALTLGR